MFECIYCKYEYEYIDGIEICHSCFLCIHQFFYNPGVIIYSRVPMLESAA